jgi:hypothetical protein
MLRVRVIWDAKDTSKLQQLHCAMTDKLSKGSRSALPEQKNERLSEAWGKELRSHVRMSGRGRVRSLVLSLVAEPAPSTTQDRHALKIARDAWGGLKRGVVNSCRGWHYETNMGHASREWTTPTRRDLRAESTNGRLSRASTFHFNQCASLLATPAPPRIKGLITTAQPSQQSHALHSAHFFAHHLSIQLHKEVSTEGRKIVIGIPKRRLHIIFLKTISLCVEIGVVRTA